MSCSSSKRPNGQSDSESDPLTWPTKLLDARTHVRPIIDLKSELVMPAWQRYNGHFYQPAASALKAAVSNSAHIVIISGGYGLVRAEENICDYERKLRCSDWPNHVIEEALVNEAIRVGAKNVVAFAPRTSQYAKVIKRTRWGSVGPQRALLVTHESHVRVGQSEVLRDLGSAFSCFWNNKLEAFPDNVKVKELM